MSRRGAPATVALLTAIVIGFAIEVLTGAWNDPERLAAMGAVVPPEIDDGAYWRLITAMFLHGNGTIPGTLLHLAVNAFALFQLGTIYEAMFGTRRFVAIYFLTGLAASLTSYLRLPDYGSSVGASGAIFGIMGAFVFSVLRSPRFRNDRVARSIVKQVVFWAFANILILGQLPQIDNAAHVGGLVAGLLLGAVLPHRAPPPPPPAEMVIDVSPYAGPAEDPAARRDDR